MKLPRVLVAVGLVAALAGPAVAGPSAEAYRTVGVYNDGDSNPLRLLGLAVAPAGYLAEWLITRPFMRLVSQDSMAPIFSYTPLSGFDYETYEEGLSTGVSFEAPSGMD